MMNKQDVLKDYYGVNSKFDSINQALETLPGFNRFSLKDLDRFYNDANVFSLGFNKLKGKGYFYGLELALKRQSLFNELHLDQRVSIFKQKSVNVGLDTFFLNTFKWADFNIVNVQDIGMGHTVYRIIDSTQRSFVVKETESVFPLFYTSVLRILESPFINSWSYTKADRMWTISEYISGCHLTAFLNDNKCNELIVSQLAKHACIGDVFGRGDRHFENYLVHENTLYPLDVSYLFWPKNEDWVDLYVKGGQSECCVLHHLPEFKSLYWKTYTDTFQKMLDNQTGCMDLIGSYFGSSLCGRYQRYVVDRLSCRDYVQQRKISCDNSLEEYSRRYEYKIKLDRVVKEDDSILNSDEMLRMYYYANKNRLTAFFLLDYFDRRYILNLI